MKDMKETPILFSTPMVQAILEGRKTQTRRVVKTDANSIYWQPIVLNGYGGFVDEHGKPVKCRWNIGDLLWVKETTTQIVSTGQLYYKADIPNIDISALDAKWKPSIFMPKAAARIWLEITDIKVERLQDISEEDAKAEGIEQNRDGSWHDYLQPTKLYQDSAKPSFQSLWMFINGEESWSANPFVWAISFKRI